MLSQVCREETGKHTYKYSVQKPGMGNYNTLHSHTLNTQGPLHKHSPMNADACLLCCWKVACRQAFCVCVCVCVCVWEREREGGRETSVSVCVCVCVCVCVRESEQKCVCVCG